VNDRERKKQEIREATDIVELISGYIPLKRAGRNYKALCPFHTEKTPSFMVNPELQIYKCFGCGAAGDVFSFIQAYERVTFPEALKMLAERCGISLEDFHPGEKGSGVSKAALRSLNALAAKFFHQCLMSDPDKTARKLLQAHHISEGTIRDFKLGYAPKRWDSFARLVEKKGLSLKEAELAGLVISRPEGSGCYDRFRHRVMFPISDAQGRIIGFGARKIDEGEEGPKYINSPESPIFDKGSSFYGLDRAKRAITEQGYAVIVEGYTDALAAYQEGYFPVVATLGTALTRNHLRIVSRYAPRVVLIFDGDEAGRKAAVRSVDLFLEEDVEARIVILQEGLDPADCIHRSGIEAFKREVGSGKEIFDFCIEQVLKEFPDTVAGRTQALKKILQTFSRCSDPAKREILLKRVSERLGVSEEALRMERRKVRFPRNRQADDERRPRCSQSDLAGRELLESVLAFPELAGELDEHLPFEVIEDEHLRQVLKKVLEERHLDKGSIKRLMNLFEETPERQILASALETGKSEEILRQQFEGSKRYFAHLRRERERLRLQNRLREACSSGQNEEIRQLLRRLGEISRKGG